MLQLVCTVSKNENLLDLKSYRWQGQDGLTKKEYQLVGWVTPFFKKSFRIVFGLFLDFGVNGVSCSDQILLIKESVALLKAWEISRRKSHF